MSSNKTPKGSGKKAARRKAKSAKKRAKKSKSLRPRKQNRKQPASARKKAGRKSVARAARRAALREAVGTFSFARDAASALADVELEKLAGSPADVRVKLDGQSGFIIAAGETRGVIKSAVVGSFVRIWVDVSGNPGSSATLKVARASPISVKVTIPQDKGQWSESQSLQVTG